MKKIYLFRLLLSASLLISTVSYAVSPMPGEIESDFQPTQQKDIGHIAAQYLSTHPAILLNMLDQLCNQRQIPCGKISNAISAQNGTEQSTQEATLCAACILAKR